MKGLLLALIRAYQFVLPAVGRQSMPPLADLLGLREPGHRPARRGARQLAGRAARVALSSLAPGRGKTRCRTNFIGADQLQHAVPTDMDTQRTIILLVFGMSLIMLWDRWQAYQGRGSILRPAVTAPAPPTGNAQRDTAPATAPPVGAAPGGSAGLRPALKRRRPQQARSPVASAFTFRPM